MTSRLPINPYVHVPLQDGDERDRTAGGLQRLPLAATAEERFAGMLSLLGRHLRAHGMRTLVVRRIGLTLRFPKEMGVTTFQSPEMRVSAPGDPRSAVVTVERGRCGPTILVAFPSGGVPSLRLRPVDVDLTVSLLLQMFEMDGRTVAGTNHW
ncbi:hypothetical protein DQ384_01670 [Sphaerisporangium album]|uniref:Uncharacterized protein n=1 Tax=Sphaerisporangium album TaxID=509200 RepID=A0A367FRW9_9ACTN|nr:hypothetical protein [Sphaerisporangium album]RCG33173.1 hypothetical protein DQ384_01670 [Sphaerisporangium album]